MRFQNICHETQFQCRDRDFYASFTDHETPPELDNVDLEEVDCIFLESGRNRYEDIEVDDLFSDKEYSKILEENLEKGKNPVYLVDLPPKREISTKAEEFMIYSTGLAGIGLALSGNPEASTLALPALGRFSSMWESEEGALASSLLNLSNSITSLGMRSIVNSAKILQIMNKTEFEVSYIQYGVKHKDMISYLKMPKITDRLNSFYGKLNYPTRDENYGQIFCELRFDDLDESYEVQSNHKLDEYQKIIREI